MSKTITLSKNQAELLREHHKPVAIAAERFNDIVAALIADELPAKVEGVDLKAGTVTIETQQENQEPAAPVERVSGPPA